MWLCLNVQWVNYLLTKILIEYLSRRWWQELVFGIRGRCITSSDLRWIIKTTSDSTFNVVFYSKRKYCWEYQIINKRTFKHFRRESPYTRQPMVFHTLVNNMINLKWDNPPCRLIIYQQHLLSYNKYPILFPWHMAEIQSGRFVFTRERL